MASGNTAQIQAYVEQMRSAVGNENGEYLALWNPSPFRGQEVQIGDVGYIYRGSFRRLFNIRYGANHRYNQGSVPDNFVPLVGLVEGAGTNFMDAWAMYGMKEETKEAM